MGPQSFFADPDPAVFLNADPAAYKCGSGSNSKKKKKKKNYEEFSVFEKDIKDCSKVRKNGDCANLL